MELSLPLLHQPLLNVNVPLSALRSVGRPVKELYRKHITSWHHEDSAVINDLRSPGLGRLLFTAGYAGNCRIIVYAQVVKKIIIIKKHVLQLWM